jgi:hypothetical protein
MEKRREPRLAASGQVVLSLTDGSRITGELVDVSAGGFRARHTGTDFCRGQEVNFEHADARGRARVVWNRIASGTVESGFMLVDDGA